MLWERFGEALGLAPDPIPFLASAKFCVGAPAPAPAPAPGRFSTPSYSPDPAYYPFLVHSPAPGSKLFCKVI